MTRWIKITQARAARPNECTGGSNNANCIGGELQDNDGKHVGYCGYCNATPPEFVAADEPGASCR